MKKTVQNDILIFNLAFGRNFASKKKNSFKMTPKIEEERGGKKVASFMRKPLIHEDDNVKDITR